MLETSENDKLIWNKIEAIRLVSAPCIFSVDKSDEVDEDEHYEGGGAHQQNALQINQADQ